MEDIHAIRLANLLVLVAEFGTIAALAEAANTSASYLSQILSVTIDRNVGSTLARKLEKAAKKPKGWMDHVHEPGKLTDSMDTHGAAREPLDDEAAHIARLWSTIPEDKKAPLRALMETFSASGKSARSTTSKRKDH